MAKNKSPTTGPVPADPPTSHAELTIKLGPTELAKGTVPADQARHLITTFGILASVCSGIGGAVLTLRAAPAPTVLVLVLAELVVALAGATLIAACGRAPAKRKRGRADQ
jgi:hypothetical protein